MFHENYKSGIFVKFLCKMNWGNSENDINSIVPSLSPPNVVRIEGSMKTGSVRVCVCVSVCGACVRASGLKILWNFNFSYLLCHSLSDSSTFCLFYHHRAWCGLFTQNFEIHYMQITCKCYFNENAISSEINLNRGRGLSVYLIGFKP